MHFLLTRPEPDAQRTAAALHARGHHAVIASLLRIEPISGATIGTGPWEAILVTSANTARTVMALSNCDALYALPVLAVGERSAQAMRDAGFSDVASADGGVSDLARFVIGRMKPGAALLYLTGEERSGDLAGTLRAQNFAVTMAVIYRAVVVPNLPPAAVEALASSIDGVLHFSRRSAEAYVDAARRAGLLERALIAAHYCLSTQVAEPLMRAGAPTIRIASRPMEADLLDLIGAEPA